MDPFIGQIVMFGGNFAPRGWAFCDGQLLPINQNQALFSILGTTYGGDGRTSFGLPDLRGRAPIHAGNAPDLSDRRLGQKGGKETATLNKANTPEEIQPVSGKLRVNKKSNKSNSEHDNMQPFQVVNFIIALQGVFPSRS